MYCWCANAEQADQLDKRIDYALNVALLDKSSRNYQYIQVADLLRQNKNFSKAKSVLKHVTGAIVPDEKTIMNFLEKLIDAEDYKPHFLSEVKPKA